MPVRYVYALDGAGIYCEERRHAENWAIKKRSKFSTDRSLPGNHTLSVQMVYQGNGYGVFSYLKGYKFTAKSSRTFTAPDGKQLQLKVVGYEKGNPVTTDPKDRPAVDFRESLVNDKETVAARARAGGQEVACVSASLSATSRPLCWRRGAAGADDVDNLGGKVIELDTRVSTRPRPEAAAAAGARSSPIAGSSTRRCSTSSRTTSRRRSFFSTRREVSRTRRPTPRRSSISPTRCIRKRDYLTRGTTSRRSSIRVRRRRLSGGAAAPGRSLAAHARLRARRRLHRQARADAAREAAAVGAVRQGEVFLLPPELSQGARGARSRSPSDTSTIFMRSTSSARPTWRWVRRRCPTRCRPSAPS